MKKKGLLIVVMVFGFLFLVAPTKAEYKSSTSDTVVSYTTSDGMINVPANGDNNINTGDISNIGKIMLVFGLSGATLILLTLSKKKGEKV